MASSITMLVLGLAFNIMIMTVRAQSTQAASGTTVPNSQQCTYTWVTSSNTNYAGGTANLAASLADCQANCIGSSTCVAVDFNTVAATGSQCYLLTSLSGQRFSSNGINHYDLTRNCQTSCTPTWTPTANTNYQGGVVNAATSVTACQAACLASSGCIAFDFNSVATAGQQCWLLNNLNGAKLSNPGITHYDLVQSCPVPYYAYLNKLYGGLRIDSATNRVLTGYDFNQLTLFTESVCLAESISTFNNTPNCVSLSPMGNSTNYVYLSNTSYQLLLQSPDATDRFKEDASFVQIPNAPTAGYYYLQPSAAYYSNIDFYITGSSSTVSVVPQLTNTDAASFFKSTIYVLSLPVTGTCPYVWTRISNAKLTVSNYVATTSSLSDCLSRCLVYPNCVGVSWQYNYNYCYLETSAATALISDTSYWYFELATSSPSPCPRGCLYTFSYQTNAAYSYSSTGGNTTSYYCRNQCVINTACLGYNWIPSISSLGTCMWYSSGSSRNSGNFTAISRTFTKCGCTPITLYNLNASDVNAVQASGVSGFSNCYTACINNRACTGFDLRSNDCYLSTTAIANKIVVFNSSYVHVDLVLRRSCGNGCQDKWDFFPSTSMTGTTQYNAATESACRQACQANSTCTAISWNTASNSCFLATSSSLRNLEGTSPGWNTYNLYRLPFCDAVWDRTSSGSSYPSSPYV